MNLFKKICKTKKKNKVQFHPIYGEIYTPPYNPVVETNSKEHEIYNIHGQKMRTFFIRDVHFAHDPAYESKYFIWDRYNIGLKTHFYSHESMLETMGKPDKKFGIFIESEAIVPESYKILDKNKGLNKDFDLIFSYSEKILNKYENARFAPLCAQIWGNKINDNELHKKKTKNISILSSNKLMCDLHKYRYDLAHKCKRENLADTFGTFDNGAFVDISSTLKDYRYSICIENFISPYFFTEKLTSALYFQTIPIYIGANKIENFFNMDGIIQISTKDDIEKILKQCTPQEYENRLSAILDNYNRVQEYLNIWDYTWEHHLKDKF